MRIAIIGRSQLLYNTASLLRENNHSISLVITAKEAPEYTKTANDFQAFARSVGAEYIYTPKVNLAEYTEQIQKMEPIDLAVSINYTGIISQKVIDLFPLGILNAHAGDLPRYRGNAPLAWAIINKEKKVGLCIHKMIGGELDSGNILAKDYCDITINTRVGELFDWIETRIPGMMLQAVNRLENDPHFEEEVQSKDPKDALRCYPRLPEDGKIDWNKTAEEIIRLINASSEPFAGAYGFFEDEQIVIWRAELFQDAENFSSIPGQIASVNDDGSITVITGKGKIKITEITFKKERIKPALVVKSIRKRLY
jgi:methionyl-tRNA formyltransferase